jgi:hypothetical protein
MSYGLPEAKTAFAAAAVRLVPLVTFEGVLQEALQSGKLGEEAADTVRAWVRDPHAWSQQHGG